MRAIFVGMAALLLAACNPFSQMDDADAQIETFHAHYSSGDFDAIYQMAAPEFRESVSQDGWNELMQFVSAGLGAAEDSSQTGFNINTDNGVTSTTITRETSFALGEGTETFTFTGSGEDMRLIGWEVQSETLEKPADGEPADAADGAADNAAASDGKPDPDTAEAAPPIDKPTSSDDAEKPES